jgi:serine/threonine protein kinase
MIMNGSWRTFTAVPQAPPKLNALLVQCLEVKPQERPSFEQILSELNGPIKDEIDENNFIRQPVGSHIHASGLHGSAENGGSLINDNISMHGGVIPVDQPEADIDTDAKFMRNPMLSTGFRGTNDSRLSQRFSQCDIMSEVELSRVEVVTRTEV